MLLSSFVVTTTDDLGAGSLRDAVQQANATPDADTIEFAAGLSGTIALGSGVITIHKPLTIVGPGADVLAVSGGGLGRVFAVAGTTASISGLTITNGRSAGDPFIRGGAIDDEGALTVSRCTFTDNWTSGGGGAIGAAGDLTVSGCTFTHNSAGPHGGGAIDLEEGGQVSDSTFSDNTCDFGGALAVNFGDAALTGCTFSQNTAGG